MRLARLVTGLGLAGGIALAGRRGDVVRFAVELHNPSRAPVTFERCPLAVEVLAPTGAPEAHQNLAHCASGGFADQPVG